MAEIERPFVPARLNLGSIRKTGMTTKKRSSVVLRRKSDAPYNAGYFAQKHDISLEQARELMRKVGRDRDKLNLAAAKLFRK